jgi:hypothetical protein
MGQTFEVVFNRKKTANWQGGAWLERIPLYTETFGLNQLLQEIAEPRTAAVAHRLILAVETEAQKPWNDRVLI